MKRKPTGLLNWISGAITDALDAVKEERIEGYVARVDAEFGRQREKFDFGRAVGVLGISDDDRPLVASRVYGRFLDRSWSDSQISARETEMLAWVARILGLSSSTVAKLNAEAAGKVFKGALAKAVSDGHVDDKEAAKLQAIATAGGMSVGELMARFFAKEGDGLLQSMFSQAASDGQLSRDDWTEFRATAERLGLPRDQILTAIRQPAQQLVEHVLADARSDGEISDKEDRLLQSLLEVVIDDSDFAAYVRQEVESAKEMQRLGKGLLPSLPRPAGLALRSGEIVHWIGSATHLRTRELSSGTKTVTIEGDAVITDTRLILNASEKSFEVSHRKVLAHLPSESEIEIRTSSKGAGWYAFPEDGHRAIAIWQAAIGRANQTLVASDDAQGHRRIPREIRQRVWQRYGGRCAECNADNYLEFDHIIPVAKGGGNSETNVQLLCRRCNLTKSDRI